MKETVLLSPARRKIFSKPFNSRTGRVMLPTRSRMYSCTTSAPSRLPVLVTVTAAVMEPSCPIDGVLRAMSLYRKVV